MGFGLPARRISKREEVSEALDEMLACETAYVLDVVIPYTEHEANTRLRSPPPPRRGPRTRSRN